MPDDVARGRPVRLLLLAARVGLPLAIAIAGVVLIVIGGPGSHHHSPTIAAAGVALLIAALIVWMVNWLFRMSVQSNRERDEEERAREYFDIHGHWPDEEPGEGA
jgi:drug/metabolite transporter (DMT)-like permease